MDFTFNKESHIKEMTPYVEKLVESLSKQGITFSPTDEHLENVIFKNDKKEIKIAHHCFYRFSGMCKIKKDGEKNTIILIDVTDDMFINQYMKSMIEFLFMDKKKEK